jgi:hypothetical protein
MPSSLYILFLLPIFSSALWSEFPMWRMSTVWVEPKHDVHRGG